MVTPELFTYIRSELAKRRTPDAIRVDLVKGGGWTTADLDEAFKGMGPQIPQVPPPSQPQTPLAPQPIQTLQPAPVVSAMTQAIIPNVAPQPVVQPASPNPATTSTFTSAAAEIISVKKKHYIGWGILLWMVYLILLIPILSDPKISAIFGTIPELSKILVILIPSVLIGVIIGSIINASILNKVSKWFKATNPSWAKAFFMIGIWAVIGGVLVDIDLLIRDTHAPAVFFLVAIIVLMIFQVFITAHMYTMRRWRALGMILVAILFLFVIIAVISIGASIILAALQTAQRKGEVAAGIIVPTTITNTSTTGTTQPAANSDGASVNKYYQQGLNDMQQNDFTQAVADFTKAITVAPTDNATTDNPIVAKIYLERAMAEAQEGGNDATGVTDANKSISLDATDKTAYYIRSELYTHENNAAAAIADLTTGISLDPKDTGTPNNGTLYLIRGSIELATSQKTAGCADIAKISSTDSGAFPTNQTTAYQQAQAMCK